MRSGITKRRSFLLIFVFVLSVLAPLRLAVHAQIEPVYDQGALGLGRLLKRLNTSASAMMIGAHPDDEDTALLAYLARGENARTAYLSLTRGDGGQNIIGPELGEALGVIRTEELLQARKLDGAEQYFTRAYDFGFSKTLAEAKEKWDEKIILCDVVRVIRDFRPLVVISQFSGTPADGHGQHQFAGYLTPMAVRAASDPGQCADAGPPWFVKKLYVRHRGGGEPGLRINTGRYDPMLGRSYFEIAMEARSQHRSQEQGVLELKGEIFSALNPVSAGSEETASGIFGSIDISVRGIVGNAGDNSPRLVELAEKIQQSAAGALEQYDIRHPAKIIPALAEGYNAAHDAEWSTRSPGPKAMMRLKKGEFLDALRRAAGLQFDVIADRETVVAGESFIAAVRVFYPDDPPIKVEAVDLRVPQGWTIMPIDSTPQVQQQFRREVPNFAASFSVKVAENAPPTQPYWLQMPRQGDLFSWPLRAARTMPLQAPEAVAEIRTRIDGKTFTFIRPVEYRYADDVRGEIRRPLAVVPLATVALDQELIIVPRGRAAQKRDLAVTVTNNSSSGISGKVGLKLPDGWTATAAGTDLDLGKRGESTTVQFNVKIPANAPTGSYSITAGATVGETTYSRTLRTIAYPHIQTHRTYGEAAATANLIDLATVPARIGYIPGSGDRVQQAIAQMGLNVETIDERTLATGNLSRFDVIVVGIRAYQVRSDIIAHNKRLLDFANAGGTLIVQYQLSGYTQQNLAPFSAQQGPRVADELAKVTIVDPAHPLLNKPNKITAADFVGWVQERNLYNFSNMDPKYTGLLESHDNNEPENRGGLVVADLGKGKYIYCSYSLFRQLPAGVPGAYRLLANMLAYSGHKGPATRE